MNSATDARVRQLRHARRVRAYIAQIPYLLVMLGVIAGGRTVDAAGHRQPLAALCRTPALRAAYAGARPSGRSVFSMLRGLVLQEVAVPEGATADVDTWDDVRRHRLS